MSKYRFKRLDEYDKSDLIGGLPRGWVGSMTKFIGEDIPSRYEKECDDNLKFNIDGYWVKERDYVKKDKTLINDKPLINNIVVENTSIEHGERIIKHFESHGIDTSDRRGLVYGSEPHRFYGVINGRFDNYTLAAAEYHGASVVKLPEDVEKDGVKYFKDLSQYIGRYLKALVDYPHGGGVRAGEIGLIISSRQVVFPSQSDYYCSEALSKEYLNIKYELMPEDYSPDLPSDEVYEYVQCTSPNAWGRTIKANNGNLIFKTSEFDLSKVENISFKYWKEILEECPKSWVESTEEEYLSQPIANHQKTEQTKIVVEERTNIPSIIKKTFIEDVQSVDVILSTKKKTIKF